MKRRDSNKIPEFRTLEEEREYWEARGPLAEGHRGRVNRPHPKQKRASFLSVRLTGEELTQLRDAAAKIGMGPSTFARYLLKQTIDQYFSTSSAFNLDNSYTVSPRCLHGLSQQEKQILRLVAAGSSNKEIAKHCYVSETTVKAHVRRILEKLNVESVHEGGSKQINSRICIVDTDKMRRDPSVLQAFLQTICASAGSVVITPDDSEYKAVRDIVKSKSNETL